MQKFISIAAILSVTSLAAAMAFLVLGVATHGSTWTGIGFAITGGSGFSGLFVVAVAAVYDIATD